VLLIIATVGVVAALLVPATLLQVGLREGTSPWFHTNDAAYQVELAGERIINGDNPYGFDYTGTGLERIYSLDGTPVIDGRVETVALQHLAYFPGLPVIGAVSAALPGPLGDVRVLMLLFALALIPAALLLPGPLELRLGAGALLAANPLLLRSTWFGILDAPVVLALVLAFALALKGRWGWTGALVALALVEKQYAFVAIPFLAVAAWQAGGRDALVRAGGWLVGVTAVVVVPFLLWGPSAFIDDTLVFGTSAYRIVGYGLSGILVDLDVVTRDGAYPFILLALVIFYFASALVGRGAGTQWVRNDRATWLSLTLGLAVAVVMISGWMRQLHTGPNIISAGDGGVLIEIQPGLEGGRDRGEQTDGQEGQEADRRAAAEDREAPATAGRGEEAAR
jgi:hypothetical protein